MNTATEQEATDVPEPTQNKLLDFGCKVYHNWIPVGAIVAGFVVFFAWLIWWAYSTFILGIPKGRIPGFGNPDEFDLADLITLQFVAAIVGYGLYRLVGLFFTSERCASALALPEGLQKDTSLFMRWVLKRLGQDKEQQRLTPYPKRKKRKSGKK